MNETILRGFCQKCDEPWTWQEAEHARKTNIKACSTVGTCEPVWFLSAKQMNMIFHYSLLKSPSEKNILRDYYRKMDRRYDFSKALISILETDPFLVAILLKEAKQ